MLCDHGGFSSSAGQNYLPAFPVFFWPSVRYAAHCSSICSDGRELGTDGFQNFCSSICRCKSSSKALESCLQALRWAVHLPRLSVCLSLSSAQSTTGCQMSRGEALRGSQVGANADMTRSAALLTLSTVIHTPCTPCSLKSANTHVRASDFGYERLLGWVWADQPVYQLHRLLCILVLI